MKRLQLINALIAPAVSFAILIGIHSFRPQSTDSFYSLSKGKWKFVSENTSTKIDLDKITTLEFQIEDPVLCCSGYYQYTESDISNPERFEALYIPAIGEKIKSISIDGQIIRYESNTKSDDGLIVKIPEIQGRNSFSLALHFHAGPGLFSGLWKGAPVIGHVDELVALRDSDILQQKTLPIMFATLFSLMAILFYFLHLATKNIATFYSLFTMCLASWSLFYLFLSGFVREINYDFGSKMHLVVRGGAWIGTWALMLSYVHFAIPEQRQKIPRMMKIGLFSGLAIIAGQLGIVLFGKTQHQWLLFSLTSPLAFIPLFFWRTDKLKLFSFGYIAYLFSWIALAGSISDAGLLLLRLAIGWNTPSLANRYTFPLLLGASSCIYVMHFARVLRRLRTNNQRLKRLNQSALVLSGTSFEPESLNEFATSLRKAMKTRRCCVAKRYSDGDYRVVGLSGILPEAFGEQIDLENNPFIKTAIKQLRPEVGTVKSRNEDRYKSMSFAVVPVTVQEHVEYLLLFSDPIKERTFSRSDLLYMRQFGLMMASSSERFESDLKFKQVVGHLDESLYNFVLGKSKKINLPDDHVSQWRGVGFFDQSSFVKSSNQVSQSELIMMVDIVKQWAAPIVMRHGGKIRSFGGDAYLFDITPLHEESKNQIAIRLSKALWDLCENQTELNRSLMTKALAPIAFRFGGHVGIVDDVSLFDLGANVTTIIGTTVNLAQRIQSVAAPATILVSQEVAELIDSTFKFSLSWNDKMKDFSPSLTLYRLDALKVPSTKSVADSETKSAV